MAERGTLGTLKMVPATDEELDSARGGRGHGEYDNFVAAFIEADIRGTKVEYDGVKVQSVKTGLKSAIDRAVKANTIQENELQVRSKEDAVYLVRAQAEETSE